MYSEIVNNFNDLNHFCDKIILETQKWRDIFEIQTEEYFKIVKNNEATCNKLREIQQKMNVLTFFQEQIERGLCESQYSYDVLEKQVGELEVVIPNNKYYEDPSSSLYETTVCLDASINMLQEAMNAAETNVNNDIAEKNENSSTFCALLLNKQLELLESLERKMYFLANELQRIEDLQKISFDAFIAQKKKQLTMD